MSRRSALGGGALVTVSIVLGAASARAQMAARFVADQRGDFVLLGNTLAHNCGGGTEDPLVGSVGECGDDVADSAADVFWTVSGGAAVASTDVSAAEASSVAVLVLPPGAVVTRAQLYWSALTGGGSRTIATLARPGTFSRTVSAGVTTVLIDGPDEFYQSTADVTEIVRQHGPGAYGVGGIDALDPVDLENTVHYAGWWMAVFYELATDPLRHLALFDGLALVSEDNEQELTLGGFSVASGGFDAKLGVVAFEGDAGIDGDELRFGQDAPLTFVDALLDSGNFFDSSRLGAGGGPVSRVGDLPRLSGEENSMSGLDLDVVDISDRVAPGQTSAEIAATTDFDRYVLGGFVSSVAMFRPDLTTSAKAVRDVNGAPLRPGDVLEYSVTISNTGTDAAVDVQLIDPLPEGVRYVPSSLEIFSGPNSGLLTDGADGDQGELDDADGQTIVVRLGAGANGALGGRLGVGEATTVVYRVTIQPGVSGIIENQAQISALGEIGGESSVTPSDGNSAEPGAPPTSIGVDACSADGDCATPTPFCDTAAAPRACVECLLDAHCDGLRPSCDTGRSCTCVAASAEASCDGRDDDCDGQIDEGFVGQPCTLGVGACSAQGTTVCDTLTTTRCSAQVAPPLPEVCLGAADEDCDGLVDLADPDCGDGDRDGLPDLIELALGTNPLDADSDDDGALDGSEPSFGSDSDVDGLINALDPDSDDDALLDGTELGLGCAGPGTRAAFCVADADGGESLTSPVVSDSDGGGLSDGSEDANLNGAQDPEETHPSAGGADDEGLADADNDALSDALEAFLATDSEDPDTDDDGVLDGLEHNPSTDSDGDGLLNVLDADSDADGLFDGTETGRGCDDPATEALDTHPALASCEPDTDTASSTSALVADTDGGGVSDGREDTNRNGRVDPGETDPNEPGDDVPSARCESDADCAPDSARVCLEGSCILGCAVLAADCPSGYVCVEVTGAIGRCEREGSSSDAGVLEPDEAGSAPDGRSAEPPHLDSNVGTRLAGGACACRVGDSTQGSAMGVALLLVALGAARLRRLRTFGAR